LATPVERASYLAELSSVESDTDAHVRSSGVGPARAESVGLARAYSVEHGSLLSVLVQTLLFYFLNGWFRDFNVCERSNMEFKFSHCQSC
jgi:hypothetical protein